MNPSETFRRAGELGDHAAASMGADGVSGLATVTFGYATKYPLATRTPDNFGFGFGSCQEYVRYLGLASQAVNQAEYALRTGGRSAKEQLRVLLEKGRTAASYGVDFPPGIEPQWVNDEASGLTVVVVGDDIKPTQAVAYARRAVKDTDRGAEQTLTEAASLVHACLRLLQKELPQERVAVAMIALPQTHASPWVEGPAIICSQAHGETMAPANFPIVAAKAYATVKTGKASGPDTSGQPVSQIPGALPFWVRGIGVRVMAAGGLPDAAKDVAAVRQACGRSLLAP